MIEASEPMTLATTVALPVVRGPVPFAKQIAAIDRLCGGRYASASARARRADYEVVGLDFEERWKRLDEVIRGAAEPVAKAGRDAFVGPNYSTDGIELEPAPAQPGGPPIWVGSWGSAAGCGRGRALADGWLASAYNITPPGVRRGLGLVGRTPRPREPRRLPERAATMWFHIADDAAKPRPCSTERIVPTVHRPEDVLRERLPWVHRRVRREAHRIRGGGGATRAGTSGRSPTRSSSSSASGTTCDRWSRL